MKVKALLATVLTISTSISYAQFAKPEDAIDYRKAAFTLMGNHMGRISAVVKGEKPFDKNEVAASASIIEKVSHLPWEAFGKGTEGGRAKNEIWSEMDKFKASADKNIKAISELDKAAKSGNLDAIKKAFGEVGQSCKTCHDSYRNKK